MFTDKIAENAEEHLRGISANSASSAVNSCLGSNQVWPILHSRKQRQEAAR